MLNVSHVPGSVLSILHALTFHSQKMALMDVLRLSPCQWWGNRDAGRIKNFPKVTPLTSGRTQLYSLPSLLRSPQEKNKINVIYSSITSPNTKNHHLKNSNFNNTTHKCQTSFPKSLNLSFKGTFFKEMKWGESTEKIKGVGVDFS